MPLTHEQAHKLIQLKMDRMLSADELEALSSHVRGCRGCQNYANEVNEVEVLLRAVMKSQWNVRPIPFPIPALGGRSTKTHATPLLTIRKAALSLVFVALFFSAWQFVTSGPSVSSRMHLSVPPVPTPSAGTAELTGTTEICEMMLYTVQGSDTLAGIADQFSVSQEEIMALNQLKTDILSTPLQLAIPLCNFTPTGTVHPATFTTTYTPILAPRTSTPEG
jgi:hypothetical protein